MDSEDHIIIVEKLTKRYADLTAVDNISFSVKKGEVFGILGPNGAGKTTTLEIIEGLLEPTSGSTTVLGFDSQKNPEQVKESIGVQLQASAYFDYLTLTEILELFGLFYTRKVSPEELLERVELQDKANSTVNKLSGGQQQRFTIAASLVNHPDVVFLDEPTTGLDPQARRNLWDFIQGMNKEGRTVVLTTHYMEEAEFLCNRVAIMDRGRIVALDTPDNLVRGLPVPYEIKLRTDNGHCLDGLKGLAAVEKVGLYDDGSTRLSSKDASATLPAVLDLANDSGVKITHLEVIPADLEDVFLSLTGRAFRE